MVHIAANLTMLFTEYPELERFDRAAAAGFTAVEFLFPYAHTPETVLEALQRNNLTFVLMNLPAGNWAGGERGIAAQPDRKTEFAEGLKTAVSYASVLRPNGINCLAGKRGPEADAIDTLVENVDLAAGALAEIGVPLTLEPVNNLDVPDFALPTTQSALDVIARSTSDNVGLQFDVYHSLRLGEDPLEVIRTLGPDIRHIQIADFPGRHQPGTGEIDWPTLFETIDTSGYSGWVSLEYIPEGETEAGFDLLRDLGLLSA